MTFIAFIALIAAACTSAAPTQSPTLPPSSGDPIGSPSPSPSVGPIGETIDHRTGSADVILRLEQGGGFVPMEFSAAQAPLFTLYGDGIMVFQPKTTTFPGPDANGLIRGIPWRTAKLDEDQIQELLGFALGPGGLGAARGSYSAAGVADAPDTIFTVNAGGLNKRVVVNALGIDAAGATDVAARSAFSQLASRLGDIDRGGSIPSDVYVAERERGILMPRDAASAGGVPIDWPWPGLEPADFRSGPAGGGDGPTLPHRTMTPGEVAALKLSGIEGGVQGLVLTGPDSKTYAFILRPLLVDEQE